MDGFPRARLEAVPVLLSYRFSIPLTPDLGDRMRHIIICTVCSWATENIGPFDPEVWLVRVYSWGIDVHFLDGDDAMKFKLAWC
jgi:hypothetical protein